MGDDFVGNKLVCCLAQILLVPAAALAQGGPPMITDDPGTPGDGHWEINLGLTVEKNEQEWLFETPLIDLNYGLGDRVQLKVEMPWLVLDRDAEGMMTAAGNGKIGVKWRFLDEQNGSPLDVSVYPQFGFPISRRASELGMIEPGVELLLPVQVVVSLGPISVNPELGYTVLSEEEDGWFCGVAVGSELNDWLELIVEAHYGADLDFEEGEVLANFGIRWELHTNFTLLASAGTALWNSEDERTALAGYFGLQVLL